MNEKGENSAEIPEMQVGGTGHAENPGDIEYGAGANKDPMEDIAAEAESEAVEAPVEVDDLGDRPDEDDVDPPVPEDEKVEPEQDSDGVLDESKVIEYGEGQLPTLKQSKKPSFNPATEQDALKDEDKEGGIVKPKTASQAQPSNNLTDSGELLKPQADMQRDSPMGKYEVTGFNVEYQVGDGLQSITVRDYFSDIDTAFASVNGEKYLMPMPGGGYKVSVISSGAPAISYNERQIYHYKDEAWVRT